MTMELTASGTALVVVDMQNGFCEAGGSCGRMGLPTEELRRVVEPCARVIAAARAAAVPVIFTRYVYKPDYSDGGVLIEHIMPDLKANNALIEGTWDIEIVAALAPRDGDHIVDKNRPSACYSADFEPLLERLGVDSVVVCGVTTNCCVETTVRDTSQKDYKTFVVEDAVAEWDGERHRVALASMAMLFAKLVKVADVEGVWSQKGAVA